MVKKIIVLSRSEEKVAEVREALEKIGIEVVSVNDCGLDKQTLNLICEQKKHIGNLIAAEVANLTGECCICDDVQMHIRVLNGAPGMVAKFMDNEGGLEKAKKDIVAALQAQPDVNWNAKMVCLLVFARPVCADDKKQEVQLFMGEVGGKVIADACYERGHDFESIFSPNGFGATLSQIQLEEKNEISHVGEALKGLMAYLERL